MHTPTTSTTASLPVVDMNDLVRILQAHLPQLRHESILYEQMEDNKEQYRTLSREADQLRKKLFAVIQDNNKYRRVNERLESQIFSQEQELAEAHKEIQVLKRQKQSLEKRLQDELENYESERTVWHQREADLCSEIKRLAIRNNPRRTRSATASNIWARADAEPSRTCPTPIFEDRPSSSSVLETKIRAQEQLIANYKAELDQQKRVLQEALLTTEAQAVQIQNLEQELGSLKQVNASLMQDNESYQILLHEKTMAGEIFKKIRDCVAEEEQPSLAAELNKVVVPQDNDDNADHATIKQLTDEIRVLQESNKALKLYMNKILMKIVDNQELVDVLNIDEQEGGHHKTGDDTKPGPIGNRTAAPATTTSTPGRRPRRSTISAWISSSKSSSLVRQRRNTNTSSSGGGWSRALKRMSVMGWSSTPSTIEEAVPNNDTDLVCETSELTLTSKDSAISSCTSISN